LELPEEFQGIGQGTLHSSNGRNAHGNVRIIKLSTNRSREFDGLATIIFKLPARAAVACSVALSMCHVACGQTCIPSIKNAKRAILITAPTMNTISAMVRLFERPTLDASWRLLEGPYPAVLGRFGMGWGQMFAYLGSAKDTVKKEGDFRTPAGVYRAGKRFGFEPSEWVDYLQIRPGDTVCVDDPYSPAYNTITSRRQITANTHAEDMGNSLYRRGVIIEYPTTPPFGGSCIFIHVWRAADRGTAGCIALPERHVATIQEFANRDTIVAILPEAALPQFGGCLPSIGANREIGPQ
jgi:L,D-peptidoglycan transpeptidase YkuD (ErfK/YbiS/YcfS/YnhG family)